MCSASRMDWVFCLFFVLIVDPNSESRDPGTVSVFLTG